MKITVLMSVYKAEKPQYLDRALQSICDDQTYKPLEIILVEDGALTPELDKIINKWNDVLRSSMIILKNEINLGLTKSLNKGLTYVKGDLIARMDSDDISHPKRFERQVEFLTKHPNVDIVGGALQEFDVENECLGIRHYPQTPQDVENYIYKASPLAHPTVMMRKRIFDEGLKYDERYRTSQDIALWYDALCSGYKIGNVDEVTIYFRREGDVFKRRSREKAFNEFKIYMNGIRRFYGLFSWKYVYPIARLVFRLMPVSVVKWIYGSKIRGAVLEKN
ncbi:MAG: glycosyltransferase [Parabacteroides sp.]|nr:glycosyltransferase [Parabacteroides sp.]